MKLLKVYSKKLYLILDDEDYDKVSNYTVSVDLRTFHATINIKGKTTQLGRFLLSYDGPLEVDHRNRNTLDYQKINLRICTHQENIQNKSKQKTKTSSRFKGVYWHRHRLKWVAHIRVTYKRKYLGQYSSEIEAAKAYNKAALSYFGEFANINRFENEE